MPAPTYQVQTVTITQSEVLSGAFTLGRGAKASIFVPSVTSCHLVLRGAVDTTSAASRRLVNPTPASSGEVRLYAGVGSLAFALPADVVGAAEWYRLEAGVAQAADAVILVETRL